MVEYQNDYILRIIEQMGSAIRRAFQRFREGGAAEESIDVLDQAIGLTVDMDPQLFLRLAPHSMVSFLEISNYDDRVARKVAEALELEAEILESEGSIIDAGTRREQAAAILASLDPARAN
ncbi:MAG: hypothetical protein HGA39_09375 [Coriobacteriia bacterium]|nr:hypothetical protein [Coriobacteriia bacterium]